MWVWGAHKTMFVEILLDIKPRWVFDITQAQIHLTKCIKEMEVNGCTRPPLEQRNQDQKTCQSFISLRRGMRAFCWVLTWAISKAFSKETMGYSFEIPNTCPKYIQDCASRVAYHRISFRIMNFSQKCKQISQGFDKLRNPVWGKQIQILSLN